MALSSVLIKNGKIWNGEQYLFGDVFVKNGMVVRIGQCEYIDVDYTYDAKGNIVSPGLVDIHMHMRGISCDDFGISADATCFPFGVTAAADASGGFGDCQRLDSFMVKNVVFVVADIKDNKADFTQTEEMLQKYGDKVSGVKVFFDASGHQVSDCKPLEQICEYAKKRNLRVMVHSNGTPVPMKQVFACLSKGDICTHTYHGEPHTVLEDDFQTLREAKTRGIIIDNGMAGGVNTDFSVMQKAVEFGAKPFTISSDVTSSSAFIRGGRYGLTMCMSMMRTMGMKEEEILQAVTSNAAKALGKDKEWGYIKEGRCADVTVLTYGNAGFDITDRAGNHLKSDKGYECLLTVCDGQVVYKK